jgi:hypothetical protein
MTTQAENDTWADEDPDGYGDADSLLGARIPAINWPEIGAGVAGTILNVETSEQRDPATGEVKTYKNGDVRRQVILTLQTKQKDDADDDGRRRLFVKGKSMTQEFRKAITNAGVQGPRIGGTVSVIYSGDGEAVGKLNAPKLFTVEYTKPKS